MTTQTADQTIPTIDFQLTADRLLELLAQTYMHGATHRLNVCVHGHPGSGKTEIIRAAAILAGRHFHSERGATMDPVDWRGLPFNNNGLSSFLRPEFLPRPEDGPSVLFIDEINRLSTQNQNAILPLLDGDRSVGGHVLPEDCVIIGACNFESDGGGITKMTDALATRMTHIEIKTELDPWCKWAYGQPVFQRNPEVIAYVRFATRNGADGKRYGLNHYVRGEKSQVSPRAWERVATIRDLHLPEDIESAAIAGAIGKSEALEFLAWCSLRASMPSIDGIMINPASSDVPEDAAVLYAVSSALVARVTPGNFGLILSYIERLPLEFQHFFMSAAEASCKAVTAEPEFTRWVVNHGDLYV